MSEPLEKPLPSLRRALMRRYPLIAVTNCHLRIESDGCATQTIGFSGSVTQLLEYGLATLDSKGDSFGGQDEFGTRWAGGIEGDRGYVFRHTSAVDEIHPAHRARWFPSKKLCSQVDRIWRQISRKGKNA